ncbi:hypothetical protein GCM10025865_11390 [Paraoerskovia sediminicola]|uniref:HTH lacI-type domain-containing protein n=1 Tax=Paraoerskovia sediminicola TaxID=1138587 RepID=A0ABM8G1A7_9CELL|nr:LacI family DNA-binding transcriptional regulator [Paraoerskovia sediminicola]BDZ41840.1 hypothetical protein GCM10025865_11390 [Paraoerskovia sediminicola]
MEPERRSTVRDVAAQVGVSIATVSRVLNGADTVAPETRDRVLAAVEQLGQGAPAPRRRREAPAGAVYVRCPYVLSDYFGLIVSSVVETAEHAGRPVLLDAGESAQRERPLDGLPERGDVAGAICILPPSRPRSWRPCASAASRWSSWIRARGCCPTSRRSRRRTSRGRGRSRSTSPRSGTDRSA